MRKTVVKTKVNLAVISQSKVFYGLPESRTEGLINVLENTLDWLQREKGNISINDIILSWNDDTQEWTARVTFFDLKQIE